MSLSIQETVEDALGQFNYERYQSYAAPVVAALVQRERDIFTSLVSAGVTMGGDADVVKAALVEVGLTAPAPQVAESNGGAIPLSQEERDKLAGIRHDLSGLMERIDEVLG